MNIVIAEDDSTTRSALEAMAARLGYVVTSVGDGATAWETLCAAQSPTLALLDWNMPELDGLEVCRNLRLQPTHAPCYLILLTASRQKDGAVEALQAGANDFIHKPCDIRELQSRLAVGAKVLAGEVALSECRAELRAAQARIAGLQTMLDDCASCPGRAARLQAECS